MTRRHLSFPLATIAVLVMTSCTLYDPSAPGNLVPPTVTEDETLPSLAFEGALFHYETFGEPYEGTIIFLHGGPGGDYRGLTKLRGEVDGVSLEDSYRLVFWDQRGAGLSERFSADGIDLDVYLDDLDYLVDLHGEDGPVYLVGHSWGGMYATAYMNASPGKVDGAVLMEPGPLTGALYTEVEEDLIVIDLMAEWLNDLTWTNGLLTGDDQARMDFLAIAPIGDAMPNYHMSTTDPMPFWRYGAVAAGAIQADGTIDGVPAWDWTTSLDEHEGPVLIIAGGNDTVIGEAFQTRQAAFFHDAEVAVIPDAGHDLPWTHPDETLALVLGYLATSTTHD